MENWEKCVQGIIKVVRRGSSSRRAKEFLIGLKGSPTGAISLCSPPVRTS